MIEKYFAKFSDKINFIELKDYADIEVLDSVKNIPLPIATDTLAEGISTGVMKKEVSLDSIIDGMICMIAIDSEFEYVDDYIKIIEEFNPDMPNYIFFKGIQFLDQGDYDRANLYFRAINIINPKHLLGKFNYALALERIAQDMFNKENYKSGDLFLKESTLEFEKTLDIDDKYALSYYKLGYHYRFNEQYLKAQLMWEKYIKLDNDDLRLQEIREQISLINDQVLLEAGLTYLSYNRFEDALDSFLKLLPNNEKWWELRYLIGNTYAALNQGDKAVDEYYIALELNDDIEDVYNELGIELFKLGKIEEAIKVYNSGISKIKSSYKLYFNRGLAYYQKQVIDLAYNDIVKAYELNPTDHNVIEMKNYIESIV